MKRFCGKVRRKNRTEPQKAYICYLYPPAKAGDTRDMGSIPGLGRSPGVGNGNLLQYFLPRKFHRQRSLVGYSAWGRSVRRNSASTHTDTYFRIT